MTYVLMLINIASLSQSFLDGSKQEERTQTQQYDRYNAGKFYLEEQNFRITFGMFLPIPDNIGRLRMSKSSNGETIEIPLVPVDESYHQDVTQYWKERDGDVQQIALLEPENYSDIYIEGQDSFRSRFTELTVDLVPCKKYKPETECAPPGIMNWFFLSFGGITAFLETLQLDMEDQQNALSINRQVLWNPAWPGTNYIIDIPLKPNEFVDKKDWFGFVESEDSIERYEYLTLGTITQSNWQKSKDDDDFYKFPTAQFKIYLDSERYSNERSKYHIFNLVGDVGGFWAAIILIPAQLMD